MSDEKQEAGNENSYEAAQPTAALGNVAARAASAIPTKVRFLIVGLVIFMSFLLYLDRFAFSPTLPVVEKELGLDEEDLGAITAWFFYAYAFCQIPAGWLSDWFGARRMLTIYVALWSVALMFIGLSETLLMICVFRALLGIGQAGAYPTAAGLLKKWVPISSRGFANSCVTMAGRGGMLLTMILTPVLMNLVGMLTGRTQGLWRVVFLSYGVLGIGWCVVYWLKFRDTPAKHPNCNDAERELIDGGSVVSSDTSTTAIVAKPVRIAPVASAEGMSEKQRIFRSVVNMVMMCAINFFVNIGWIFLATFMPLYLVREHDFSLTTAGAMTSLAGLAGIFGSLCGGLLTDRLVRRFGLAWGRRVPGIIAGGSGALVYYLSLYNTNAWVLVALFCSAYFLVDLGLPAIWSTYQDIGGTYVATILGFANMCGNLAAAIYAEQIGAFAKEDQWAEVFYYSCISMLIVMACWCFVNASIPMVREPTPAKPAT